MRVLPALLAVGLGLASLAETASGQTQDSGEPDLPAGLGEDSDEPALPGGLEDGPSGEPEVPSGLEGEQEPALPGGLQESAEASEPAFTSSPGFSLPFRWNLTVDARAGVRVLEPVQQRRASLGEARLQVHVEKDWETWASGLALTADLVADPVLGEYDLDLESGQGVIDLRESYVVASPLKSVDLKLGRQVLTWGTGDLLFINDLFPKDWTAFLIGREIDYLKAPSDAIKVSAFHSLANLDLVFTPRFDADRYPDRRRLSSWDPGQGQILGRDTDLAVWTPDRWFRDNELAARLYRRVNGHELALYAYRGFWKSPAGADMQTGEATFPALSVYGASARRSLAGGIANLEAGYYDSREDRQGKDPLVRNSELRALAGYEKPVGDRLTLGGQYYLEYMRHHEAYVASSPAATALSDRARQVITVRASYHAMRQRLRVGLFVFASPTDLDLALMPQVSYVIDDHWQLRLGANLFAGRDEHTFFSQLESNSNVYTGVRGAW